jgi:outer membrane phospholipase A
MEKIAMMIHFNSKYKHSRTAVISLIHAAETKFTISLRSPVCQVALSTASRYLPSFVTREWP